MFTYNVILYHEAFFFCDIYQYLRREILEMSAVFTLYIYLFSVTIRYFIVERLSLDHRT